MDKFLCKDIVNEIISYLDIQSSYNFLLCFNEHNFSDELSLMKKIIDNFDKFCRYVYNKNNCDYCDVYNPSENLLNILRNNNFNIYLLIIFEEFDNNPDFYFIFNFIKKIFCSKNSFMDYLKTTEYGLKLFDTSGNLKSYDELKSYDRCFVNYPLIFKQFSPSYITIPFSLYLFYKKFNIDLINDMHIGVYTIWGNRCSEFQDELLIYTFNKNILTVNCNSRSKLYGKVNFLQFNGKGSYTFNLDVYLYDLIDFSPQDISSIEISECMREDLSTLLHDLFKF